MANQKYIFIFIFLIISSLTIIFSIITVDAANIIGYNYKNISVQTRVNITNSRPEVLGVVVFQEQNASQLNITLNATLTRTVTCNATIRDWNGYNDISNVNATFYDNQSATPLSADDNNTHYTNYSCVSDGSTGYYVNYTCTFQVYYYANSTQWRCNVTVNDTWNTKGSGFNKTYIYALYALNVTDGIDFGNMEVETYSANISANVTNFGNKPVNVTVFGYGTRFNDGLAMNCSLGGNITVDNEKFATNDTTDFTLKTTLTSSAQHISGLTMIKQTDPATFINNATYWQLYTSSNNNPGGNCSGYVVFSAEAP